MSAPHLYLAMVVAAFSTFGVTLLTSSIWSRVRREP